MNGLKLTRREMDVLDWLMQGYANKEIAQRLNISCFTVRDHVSSLLFKHGVKSRLALMVVCGRLDNGR